jgi:hypothetical protein
VFITLRAQFQPNLQNLPQGTLSPTSSKLACTECKRPSRSQSVVGLYPMVKMSLPLDYEFGNRSERGENDFQKRAVRRTPTTIKKITEKATNEK